MRFNLLVLLALVSATSAFLIPDGMEDGVYEHYVDENGKDVHIKIANHTGFDTTLEPYTPAPVSGPSRIMKRDSMMKRDYVECGDDKQELNHHDTDWTNSKIDEQCNNGAPIPRGGNKWAKSGDVIAFTCNYHLTQSYCSAAARRKSSEAITQYCGWYKPGWNNVGTTGTMSYGYYRGNNICGYTVG